MRVTHITADEQRDAYLARLCAEVYGQRAGLKPLVVFAGTRRKLFAEEAARMLALVDDGGRPLALVLLALDEAGEGMTLVLSCALGERPEHERRLIGDLADKAPLRVDAEDRETEDFYRACGIARWFSDREGRRIGLSARHPAVAADGIAATLGFDESAVLRSLKHDARGFEEEKRRFVDGLAAFRGM